MAENKEADREVDIQWKITIFTFSKDLIILSDWAGHHLPRGGRGVPRQEVLHQASTCSAQAR